MGLKLKKEVFRTMPRNSRKNLPGLFHHIMSQGINKEYIFNDEKLKEKYKEILTEKMKQNNISIIAYCIMDNHVHLLIKVQNVQDMCRFMQQVNTTYAKFYNRVKHRVGFVFRNRYLSKAIQDENQLNKCIVYIHKNPVVAKMVEKESQYKFSSYNEYIKYAGKNSETTYKDNELTEFDNFEEKEEVDFQKILNKYKNLTENEKIKNLNEEEKISERKLAEIFNKTRHQIRKILKHDDHKEIGATKINNVPNG